MNEPSPSLLGKTALVTGSSQGLGKEIARHFVMSGASVMLCARSESDLKQAQGELSPAFPGQRVLAFQADIGDEQQVDRLAQETLLQFDRLDVLVNNAGIYGPMGALETVDWKEWLDAIRINLTGTAYLTRALIPAMKQSRGRILFLSGGGATNPLPGISAYAASKAAIVRLCETLALELKPHGVSVNAVAPGALATRLTDQLLEAGREKVGAALYEKMAKVKEEGGTPLDKAARLCVYLAGNESGNITGKLISAAWDPWERLHEHAKDLESDIYTLRRITARDRGKDWES
jgi:3-oxoacyl-[acyl-carrier protein] reductase